MKIEYKDKKEKVVNFKDIQVLTWFKYMNKLYMKIHKEKTSSGVNLAALREDGHLVYFDDYTDVIPCEPTLILEE